MRLRAYMASQMLNVLASFPVYTPRFFFAYCKKSGREPCQIRHVKCVISAGRVRGFCRMLLSGRSVWMRLISQKKRVISIKQP